MVPYNLQEKNSYLELLDTGGGIQGEMAKRPVNTDTTEEQALAYGLTSAPRRSAVCVVIEHKDNTASTVSLSMFR